MGRVRAASLVLAALAAGLFLVACGGGGSTELLPGTTADQITSNLDQVRASYEEGDCEEAEDGVAKVSTEVDELEKVDVKLKKALKQGAAKLSQVVSTCGAAEKAEEEQAEEEAAEEEQAQLEAEEATEEEAFEKEQKVEEREEKEESQEKAEKHAEQPGPSEEGEESNGKAKGHEKQEETVEPPTEGEEEVTPPATGEGAAGGIGPSAEVEGGP
jgi:hypothetical protein